MHKQLSLFLVFLLVNFVHGQEWTRHRGPNGSGISDATGFPTAFNLQKASWETTLLSGYSSPVIWGDKLFLTGYDRAAPDQRSILCLSTKDGSVNWQSDMKLSAYHLHKFNGYAASTPAVDAERVYVSFVDANGRKIHAFDHAGKKEWTVDLGGFKSQHGGAQSPVLIDGQVIIQNDHLGESSAITALDPASGKILWQRKRVRDQQKKTAYSMPMLVEVAGKQQLIFADLDHGVTALEPKSGELIWETPANLNGRTVGSPAVAAGVIFVTGGSGNSGKGSIAVKPGASGKVEKVYEPRRNLPYVPCIIGHKGLFFLWGDTGVVTCLDAVSGDILWSERVDGGGFSSPVCVNDVLYRVDKAGEMHAIAAAKTFKHLGITPFDIPGTKATPAISGGKIFFRLGEGDRLVCFESN